MMANTAGTHSFGRAYTLDALGRVLGETRGDWIASAIDTTREERNWASRDYDLDTAGVWKPSAAVAGLGTLRDDRAGGQVA